MGVRVGLVLWTVACPGFWMVPGPKVDDDCEIVCAPDVVGTIVGSTPPGVSYWLQMAFTVPGAAEPDCVPCEPCEGHGSMIFDGHGTDWCVEINLHDGNPPFTTSSFSRSGKLQIDCGGLWGCFQATIVSCTTGGQVRDDVLCLNCTCPL